MVVGSNDNHLHAFYANGSASGATNRNWVDSILPLARMVTIYVALDNKLHAVNPSDGSVKWTYETIITSLPAPLLVPGLICFGPHDSGFYALNQDGSCVNTL